jgi:diaminopimelate decarboxylase
MSAVTEQESGLEAMTLAQLLPSVGRIGQAHLEREVWPAGAAVDDGGDLIIGGMSMVKVAAMFGTPTYVIDEADVRLRCRQYRAAVPDMEISYAGKALLTRAIACWMRQERLSLDVCSAGELAVARAVGFPSRQITMHGNAKTSEDLKAAVGYGVGRIVLDSFDEIDQVAAVARGRQQVLIRVTPGVDGHTHPSISTGVEDQKFGFSLQSGAAAEAVRRVLAQPALELTGLHCHLGSQLVRVASFEEAARRMLGLLAQIRDEHAVTLGQLVLGGGHAVRYQPEDPGFDLGGFACRVHAAVAYECDRYRLPEPRLGIEPGRSLVARAGVTLYRVVTVKQQPGGRTFVVVDGGMSDNVRPALYGAGYTARLIGRRPGTAETWQVTVAGRHCEAGDLLATDVTMPADVGPGDLVAVACTGAYHHPLASNYNLVCRPPLVAVEGGEARLLVRRETEEDLQARDVGL